LALLVSYLVYAAGLILHSRSSFRRSLPWCLLLLALHTPLSWLWRALCGVGLRCLSSSLFELIQFLQKECSLPIEIGLQLDPITDIFEKVIFLADDISQYALHFGAVRLDVLHVLLNETGRCGKASD